MATRDDTPGNATDRRPANKIAPSSDVRSPYIQHRGTAKAAADIPFLRRYTDSLRVWELYECSGMEHPCGEFEVCEMWQRWRRTRGKLTTVASTVKQSSLMHPEPPSLADESSNQDLRCSQAIGYGSVVRTKKNDGLDRTTFNDGIGHIPTLGNHG
uniref:Uncharacterized protein n=1 Tax=Hyaloperonospora arabidopsidis (strain Emoy2) TaxID=559515 RepID=M4B245_HYAAE